MPSVGHLSVVVSVAPLRRTCVVHHCIGVAHCGGGSSSGPDFCDRSPDRRHHSGPGGVWCTTVVGAAQGHPKDENTHQPAFDRYGENMMKRFLLLAFVAATAFAQSAVPGLEG